MSPRIKPQSAKLPTANAKRLRLRPWVWAALVLIVGLGVGAHYLWRHTAPNIARRAQYVITADDIHITTPPAWIRSDVKAEALRDIGLEQPLSVLDDWPATVDRVTDAFEFHPWVAPVDRISKRLPSSLAVEITYRRPVAAVESSDSDGVAFIPIDERAIRLPEADFTDAERRRMPRISGVTGRPLVGDRWDDPRVQGGAKLAAALADVWQQLQLVEILGVVDATAKSDKPRCTFEIVAAGGTRILWGVEPGMEAATGETPCDQKRSHLLQFTAQHGGLDSIDGPAKLDVRREFVITPRTARNQATKAVVEAAQTK
ncbi:MAG TPA: hypothetical protein VJ828_02710 [Lacipirellulaceae bacterium]|nr:hypothetical protein [Lacipirellulaceae bacterium]